MIKKKLNFQDKITRFKKQKKFIFKKNKILNRKFLTL